MVADQPVTPDREALIDAVTRAPLWLDGPKLPPSSAASVVDAVLPLLTDALDRARQQGRDEAAAAIERFIAGVVPLTPNAFSDGYTAGMAAAARLARGGPNRKDEE